MTRTQFLARLLGLFTLLVCGWMLLDRPAALDRLQAVLSDGALSFALGLVSVGVGLALVIGHNVWRGGVLPVLVTLVGWLILAKGAFLTLLTPDAALRMFALWRAPSTWHAALAAYVLLGAYLTVAGFWSRKGARVPVYG